MEDFSINEMQEMQQALQDKYKDRWEPICPETGPVSYTHLDVYKRQPEGDRPQVDGSHR